MNFYLIKKIIIIIIITLPNISSEVTMSAKMLDIPIVVNDKESGRERDRQTETTVQISPLCISREDSP